MKKIALIILSVFLSWSVAMADWTPTSAAITRADDWNNSSVSYEITIILESDGSDASEFALSTYLTDQELKKIRGGLLYSVVTDQGTTDPETYTVTFDDEKGSDILSVTTTETGQAEVWPANVDLGAYPMIWDIQIDFGDVGDSGDDIVLYLRIIK